MPLKLTAACTALVLAGVIAAGCGGEDETTAAAAPAATKAEFVKEGDVILCTKSDAVAAATEQIAAVRKPTAEQLTTVVQDDFLPAVQTAYDGLAALPVPAGDETEIAAMLARMKAAIATVEADPAALVSGPDPFTKSDGLITACGITGCPA
jgi:hypothetical protein